MSLVVPKMSESPTAVIATMSPNFTPLSVLWAKRSAVLGPAARTSSPSAKRAVVGRPGNTSTSSGLRSGSRSSTSSGSMSASRVTRYLPG